MTVKHFRLIKMNHKEVAIKLNFERFKNRVMALDKLKYFEKIEVISEYANLINYSVRFD